MQELTVVYLALIVAISFASSIISAISGFGGGLIIMPFLTPAFGVKGVVPVITIAFILGNLSRAFVYRRDIQPRLVLEMCASVVPGVVVGTFIYDRLPPTAVAVFIGCFLILSIPLRRSLKGRAISLPQPMLSVVGFCFGIITGASPGAGVILVSMLLSMGLAPMAIIGTDAAIGTVVNIVKATMFGRFELLDVNSLLVGLVIGVTMVPGAYAARSLVRRLPLHVHVRGIELLVVAIGVFFLWKAATGA